MLSIDAIDPLVPARVDLTNCDREPIHIPGLIQPHGLLFVLDRSDLRVRQLSENSLEILGVPPQELLGADLTKIMSSEQLQHLRQISRSERLRSNPLYVGTLDLLGDKKFDATVHLNESGIVLELEPAPEQGGHLAAEFYGILQEALDDFGRSPDLLQFCQLVADHIRTISGFDRVMIYRFSEDGHGTVIAEALEHGLEPFLGLNYPASDIPKQARALYLRNWIRLIGDSQYKPVPVVPIDNPVTGQPLDMSYCILRSVSPIHLEYLKNMGVGASMSISIVRENPVSMSIIQENQLWGLIAMHHSSPHMVSYEVRAACEVLGRVVSM